MRVEVLKPFGVYSVGAVIPAMYPGQARTLIARGLVREAPEPSSPAPGEYVDRQMRAAKRVKAAQG